MAQGEWLVESPVLTHLDGGGSRLDLAVAGFPLWFETRDAVLRSRPEAWITALAISAARIDAEIVLTDPLPDPAWLESVQVNVALAASWWGGRDRLELRSLVPDPPTLDLTVSDLPEPRDRLRDLIGRLRRSRGRRPIASSRPPATARGRLQCFTGGLDSFFSLLAHPEPPTHLLYVHGFDVRLDDHARRAAVSRTLRDVAADHGVSVVELATNLHNHPAFSSATWEHTHGAALSACGMLLSGIAERLVIPPSDAHSLEVPWGSRPDLDERWSVPGDFVVEHGDGRGNRWDRLVAVAAEPLVRRHLRVCWEHRTDDLNCGLCEKCLWATAALDALGELSASSTFAAEPPPSGRLDGLAVTQTKFFDIWTAVRDHTHDTDLRDAVDRLLERSREPDAAP